MADKGGIDLTSTVKIFFEREDDHHAVDPLLHPAETLALPCPELRTYEIENGNIQFAEFAGETEIDVREIDKDGSIGSTALDRGDEAAVLAIDTGHVADDFGDAHMGDVLGADDAIEARCFHLFAAETEEGSARVARAHLRND